MNESYWKKVKADMQRQSDEALVHGECPLWEYPRYRWMFFGELLHKAKSYAEFALMAVTKGYVNSDPDRRYDETINLSCRYEPYESFIYEEACSHRGNGKMTAKAQKFRDELIALETQNGERDTDGTIIPTKYEIEHCRQTRKWCHDYHPDYFKLRGVEDDIVRV